MTNEIEFTLPVKDIHKMVRDGKLRELIDQCAIQEPGRIGECAEDQILERLIELFGEEEREEEAEEEEPPACMREWIESELSTENDEKCIECVLPVTIQWYIDELKARGEHKLADNLERMGLYADPLTTAEEMDKIKEAVDEDTRKRLLDFDAATQVNA